MTKKKFLLVILMMVMLPLIGVNVNATAGVIPLQVGIEDPTNGQTNPNKSPVEVPTVSIDGYTLFIDGINTDYTLELVDANDTVVYSTFVPSTMNVVVLPSTLSGNYELRLYPGGSYYFYGYISL